MLTTMSALKHSVHTFFLNFFFQFRLNTNKDNDGILTFHFDTESRLHSIEGLEKKNADRLEVEIMLNVELTERSLTIINHLKRYTF